MHKVLFVLFFLSILSTANSQNWTGNINSDWNNPANWSSAPTNGNDLTIDPTFYTGAAASPTVLSNSIFSPGLITISGGAQLTIGANLTTQDDLEVVGSGSTLIVNNGTLSVNMADGGRLIIDLGANMTVNNGSVQVGERFISGENSLITINDGTVSSGERLLMDLGGHIVQNGGVVSTAAVFALADGSATQNSSYFLNGGALNITGEMAFENESGNFEPTFEQNGGTLNVNGNVFWFGAAPGLGTPRFVMNDGTTFVTGTIENMALSTVDMYLKLGGDAIFNYYGNSIQTLNPTDSIIMEGNSILYLHNTVTIINPGVFHAFNGLTYVNNNTTITGTGSYQFHDFIIAATKQFIHQSPSTIRISGNTELNGTFAANSNTVIFNGVDYQLMQGTNPQVFHNMEINNNSTDGVSLFQPLTIQGNLNLISGKFNTTADQSLVLTDGATASSGSSLSFVNGPMTKIGNDPFIFPIGKNDRWARFGISAANSVNASYRAEYFDESFSAISPVNSPISAVSNLEYWNLSELVPGGSINTTLFWEDAASSAITSCPDLTIGHWNGSAWENILATTTGSCQNDDSGNVTSNAPSNQTGIFTFAYYNGVTTQNISICSGETLNVGSNVYSTSGTYLDILTDLNMQDSIVITNLSIVVPDASYEVSGFNIQALNIDADQFQWIDCEQGNSPIPNETNSFFTPASSGIYSLQTTSSGCVALSDCFSITILNELLCSGESLTVGNNTYFGPGNYTDLLQGIAVPDSIVFTSLSFQTINTQVTVNGPNFAANEQTADSYQWINCSTNVEVPGANASSFIATEDGLYAVIVSQNGCSDTSACMMYSTINVLELNARPIRLYPNPARDLLNLRFDDLKLTEIIILDFQGKRVRSFEPMIELSIIDLPNGIYTIHFISETGIFSDRFTKLD